MGLKGPDARGGGIAAGATSPSAPVVGSRRRQAGRQRVFARQQPEGDRDLPPSRDAQLLPQNVAVSFRRSRRDAENEADLVVRQALGDQLDDLALAGVMPDGLRSACMGPRVRSGAQTRHRPKGVSRGRRY